MAPGFQDLATNPQVSKWNGKRVREWDHGIFSKTVGSTIPNLKPKPLPFTLGKQGKKKQGVSFISPCPPPPPVSGHLERSQAGCESKSRVPTAKQVWAWWRLGKPKMHVSWNSRDPGCREPLVRPGVGVKQKVQTSDPDLVTQLSKEEPADPSVMTAAQGSSAPDAAAETMGPLWAKAGVGDVVWVAGGPGVFSRTSGGKCCVGRAEYCGSPNPMSTRNVKALDQL